MKIEQARAYIEVLDNLKRDLVDSNDSVVGEIRDKIEGLRIRSIHIRWRRAMTDNEIIKAKELLKKLEEAYNAYYDTSKSMPYDIDTTIRETAICLESAISEINRQKAEIERLHNILLSFTNEVHTWSNKKGYDTTELSLIPILNEAESVREAIKAEAITEFAERLHKTIDDFRDRREMVMLPYTESALCIIEKKIDQIAKEMKEGVNK